MRVEILNASLEESYEEYVRRQPHALFSSSLLFRNFILQLIPGVIPFYLVALEESGKVCGVLPSFLYKGAYGPVLNSMPWYGSNPGILADDEIAFFNLLHAFHMTAEWTGCVTSTIITRPFENLDSYETFFFAKDKKVYASYRTGMMTLLPEYDENIEASLFHFFDPKTRNQIKKGRKEGEILSCSVMEERERNLVLDWIKMIHQQNMKKMGAPSKDKEFDIFKKWGFGQEIDAFIMSTPNDYVPMGAVLLKYYNTTVDYCIPALDLKYRSSCVMNGCIMEAMINASKRGFRYWNWGGTIKTTMPGVYHFKKNFGAEECQYKYYTMVYDNKILNIPKRELLRQYPFFYVVPFGIVTEKENEFIAGSKEIDNG